MKGHYSVVWDAVAQALPERPAIITTGHALSYGEFREQAASLATFFTQQGLIAGDPVAILMYNRPEYLVTFFSCFATGLTPVPINYRYKASEVADLLEDSKVQALVYTDSVSDVVLEALKLIHRPLTLIEISDGGVTIPEATRFEEIISTPGELPATPPSGGELRLYTGGTTGRPKAVVWGTEDILEVQLYSIYTASGIRMPDDMNDVVNIAKDPLTSRVVTLPLAPFMHGTALFNSINTLVTGGTVVIHASPKLDAKEALALALEQQVTRIIVAGDAIALPLMDASDELKIENLGNVSSIISSGMRFSDATKERIHRKGNISIIDILAATEGGPFAVCLTTSIEDLPGKLQLLPGAVVLDQQMNEIQGNIGAQGILAFRGTLPRGYYDDEKKTAETFPLINGTRHVMPGDWVKVLPDKCVELLGRGSGVINTGGEKVYPLEVEEALLTHPSVVDTVVFGLPDTRFGETVNAVVVSRSGADTSESELLAHVDTVLAGFKKPKRIFFTASLDRSPHGKIDMKKIKAFALQQSEKAEIS